MKPVLSGIASLILALGVAKAQPSTSVLFIGNSFTVGGGSRGWDAVVMHGYSTLDADKPRDPAKLIATSAQIADFLRTHNSEVELYLMATWSRGDQTYSETGAWAGEPIRIPTTVSIQANSISGPTTTITAVSMGTTLRRWLFSAASLVTILAHSEKTSAQPTNWGSAASGRLLPFRNATRQMDR